MTKLIHMSPLGSLEIPGVLGQVKPGELFEIADEIARGLLTQHDIYRPAVAAGYGLLTVLELQSIADARGVSVGADAKKADIIAALKAADAEEASA